LLLTVNIKPDVTKTIKAYFKRVKLSLITSRQKIKNYTDEKNYFLFNADKQHLSIPGTKYQKKK
jgi:hypothetical protein